MVEGVRRKDGQLCLTNPEVLDIVTARVLEHMRADPSARIFSVSSNDWFNPCDCPVCRKAVEESGAQSGPLLRFVNAVAGDTPALPKPHLRVGGRASCAPLSPAGDTPALPKKSYLVSGAN